MAMNIISKEKKEIHWIGLPTNSVQECEHIQVGTDMGVALVYGSYQCFCVCGDAYINVFLFLVLISFVQEELSEYEKRISSKKAELHELLIQVCGWIKPIMYVT